MSEGIPFLNNTEKDNSFNPNLRDINIIISIVFRIWLVILLTIFAAKFFNFTEKFLGMYEYHIHHPVSPTMQEQLDALINYYCIMELPGNQCPGFR